LNNQLLKHTSATVNTVFSSTCSNPTQPEEEKKNESESKQVHDGGLASDLASGDTTHGDGNGNPVLSLADMQKRLAGVEKRIINTLTAQISANHSTIARHDQTIQAIET